MESVRRQDVQIQLVQEVVQSIDGHEVDSVGFCRPALRDPAIPVQKDRQILKSLPDS